MKNLLKVFVLATIVAPAVLIMTACVGQVHGAGSVVSHDFEVSNFNGVRISGGYVVNFEYSAEPSVSVEMQENLFEHLRVQVRDNILHIDSKKNFVTTLTNTPHINISAPNLNSLDFRGAVKTGEWDKIEAQHFTIKTSGSSDIVMSFEVDQLDITTAGSARLTLSGSAPVTKIKLSGSAKILALNLQTADIDIRASGSCSADIACSTKLNVVISGAGLVRYSGSPTVTQKISGSGKIQPIG